MYLGCIISKGMTNLVVKQLLSPQEIEMRFYVIQESHQNMINDLSKDIIKLKQANNSLKTAEFLSHETIMQLVRFFFSFEQDSILCA